MFYNICPLMLLVFSLDLVILFNIVPKTKELKYILVWTPCYKPITVNGLKNFIECPIKNCYMTMNRTYKPLNEFDAVIFHGPHLLNNASLVQEAAKYRTKEQLFIFFTFESPSLYPMCDRSFNGIFNITISHKLNSNIVYKYFSLQEKTTGAIIAPEVSPHWLRFEDMEPIDEEFRDKFKMKYKAAAWLVSRCHAHNYREVYARQLKSTLHWFGLHLDIFGYCGSYVCGERHLVLPDCWELIQSNYYFYLSFENSFAEDYVTEKVLNPLKYYTVPIVFGGANYTRFLPPGSYLNARKMTPFQLAELMSDIISEPERYYDFFRWHNHYSVHNNTELVETNFYCTLCKYLNEVNVTSPHINENIVDWYTPKDMCANKIVAPLKYEQLGNVFL